MILVSKAPRYVNKESRVLHYTCMFSPPAFASQLQNITSRWPVLIFHSTEGKRLIWPGLLVIYVDCIRGQVIHLSNRLNAETWYENMTASTKPEVHNIAMPSQENRVIRVMPDSQTHKLMTIHCTSPFTE